MSSPFRFPQQGRDGRVNCRRDYRLTSKETKTGRLDAESGGPSFAPGDATMGLEARNLRRCEGRSR